MDAKTDKLRDSLAGYGVPDPEPLRGLPDTDWWDPDQGRFGVCGSSCGFPLCTAGSAWNEWADRRNLPRTDATPYPGGRRGR